MTTPAPIVLQVLVVALGLSCASLPPRRESASSDAPLVRSEPPEPVDLKVAPASDPCIPSSASPAGPPGSLIISSKPVARVFIDGVDTGRSTPVPPREALIVAPGVHLLRLDDGHGLRAAVCVNITAGQQYRVLGVELQR